MQQQTARCLIDVLSDADQPSAGCLELGCDDGVVVAVPGQPVDLVDDDEVGPGFGDIAQQLLQAGSVSGPSAFAGVDELLDDLGAQLLGLATAGFALCRD